MPSPRRRLILVIGAVAVLAIGLFFWLRGRGDAPGATGAEAARPHRDDAVGSTSNDRGARTTPRRGASDPASPDGRGASGGGVREYTTEHGGRVRDHAPNPDVEPAVYPGPMPPEQRTMSSQLTSALARSLRPIIASCTKDIPVEDRGKNPTVMVTLTLDVGGGSLRATDAAVSPVDIAADHRERLSACVREQAASLVVPSGDEPDRSDYVAHFPIALR